MSARLSESGRLTSEAFLAFLEERPDEERWELFDGVPVMMASPRLSHQRIGFNIARLLNEALEVGARPGWLSRRAWSTCARPLPPTCMSRMSSSSMPRGSRPARA